MQSGLSAYGYDSNPYIYAAKQVNYANKQLERLSNHHYTNAKLIHLLCKDVAHSALVIRQASDRLYELIENKNYTTSIGTRVFDDVDPSDLTKIAQLSTLVGSRNNLAISRIMDASNNLQTTINAFKITIEITYEEATSIFINYRIAEQINIILVKTIKFLTDTLHTIVKSRIAITSYTDSAGKPRIIGEPASLVSQYRNSSYNDSSGIIHIVGTPSATLSQYRDSSNILHLPLDNAVYVAKLCLIYLNQVNSEISQSLPTTQASSTIQNLGLSNYTTEQHLFAKEKEVDYYLSNAVLELSLDNIEKLRIAGANIYEPSVLPNTPIRICNILVKSTELASVIATDARLSASSSRGIEEAITDLQTSFYDSSGVTLDSFTRSTLKEARIILTNVLNEIDKVLSNSSAATAIKLTLTAYNTIFGILKKAEEREKESIRVSDDIYSILHILHSALISADSLSANSNISDINKLLWDTNMAKANSERIVSFEKKLFEELTWNTNKLVTPDAIMAQTQSANTLGAQNIVDLERIARLSANAPIRPPEAYSAFKAEIRATQTPAIRPSLDKLISRHCIKQLRQDSVRTVVDTKVKAAQEAQFIRDMSRASFRN